MQVEAAALERIAQTILAAAGSSADEADKVAQKLVGANLAGHDSHGVIRVPQYVEQVAAGHIVPNRNAEVVSETEVVTVLDGHSGYGQIVGEQSVQAAIDKARRARHRALGAARLGPSRPARRLGRDGGRRRHGLARTSSTRPASRCASCRTAGATAAAPPTRSRWASRSRAASRSCSTSRPPAIAEGKVRVARNKGVAIPPDCLLDADGQPTTDPNQLYTDPPGNLRAVRRRGQRPQGRRALADGRSAGRRLHRRRLLAAARGRGALQQQHALDRDRARGLRRRRARRRDRALSRVRQELAAARRRTARCCCRASPSSARAPSAAPRASRSIRPPGTTSWPRASGSGSRAPTLEAIARERSA